MHFQVHTRHYSCTIGRSGTCNCAVAVREGNDILGIQACNGPPTLIRYLRDPNTPDGKADIKLWYSSRFWSFYVVSSLEFRIIRRNNLVGFSLYLLMCSRNCYCLVWLYPPSERSERRRYCDTCCPSVSSSL